MFHRIFGGLVEHIYKYQEKLTIEIFADKKNSGRGTPMEHGKTEGQKKRAQKKLSQGGGGVAYFTPQQHISPFSSLSPLR